MSEFNGVTQPINVMRDMKLKSHIQDNREKLSTLSCVVILVCHLGVI